MPLRSEMYLLLPSLKVWERVLASDWGQDEFFIPEQ